MAFDAKRRETALQEISKEILGESPSEEVDDSPDDQEVESIDEQTPEKEEKAEQSDDGEIKTLTELATAIGLDPAQLYDLEIKLAESGESVKLGSLKDELQTLKKQQADFEKLRTELETEKVQTQQKIAEQTQAATQLSDAELKAMVAMAQCQEDYKRIDWEEFEKLDAGRCALEQQKLINRYTLAQNQYQQAQAQKQQLGRQQYNEQIAKQHALMLKLVPEWADQSKCNADIAEITAWANESYGLSNNELATVIDARHRDIIRKAYLYDKLQKSKGAILKSSVKQLAGGSKPIKPSDVQDKNIKNLVSKARRTRNMNDQIAAARAILENS